MTAHRIPVVGERHFGSSGKSVFNGDDPTSYLRRRGRLVKCRFRVLPGVNPANGHFDHEYILEGDIDFPGANWSTFFGSKHLGVCHFVFADGSVKGLSPAMDFTTYHRLAVLGDGGVVGSF